MLDQARWVGAKSADMTYVHAVWVESNTAPITPEHYGAELDPAGRRQRNLEAGVIREGVAVCGAQLNSIVAGAQGGHDWDRVVADDKCMMCHRLMDPELFLEAEDEMTG